MKHLILIAITAVFPFVLSAQGLQNVPEWLVTDSSVTPKESQVVKQQHTKPLEYGLREVLQLHPVIFHWKDEYDNHRSRMGFLPSEMDDVIGDAVNHSNNVSNADVVPVTVAALQEIYQLVQFQQDAMEKMRQENLELKDRIDQLEKTVNAKKITP